MTATSIGRPAAPAPATLVELLDRDRLSALGVKADAVALTDGTATATWSEYGEMAARWASVLLDLGVEPGDRVAVHVAKSVRSFVIVHAVLRAGAVMVPVDPLAPPAHVRRVLDEGAVSVLVTDARPARLPRLAGLDDLRGAIVTHLPDGLTGDGLVVRRADEVEVADPAAPVAVDADDPAYIIFTSGSTGVPKGIVHTHRSALAYARLASGTYGLTTSDRLANVAALHFDQSTFELYAAPLVGASVVVVPEAVLRFPASVAELVERERATVWYSVPYVLREVVARGNLATRDLALRWILYGGENYPPAAVRELMLAVPDARVSNVYGPAEVNQCAYHHLDEPPTSDDPVPIGRAWEETELVVVEPPGASGPGDPATAEPATAEPVPPGVAGELLVSATTMMQGYWRRPEATRRAIVEAVFPGRIGSRWYRTGDLVTTDGEGRLVFVGRVDHQVKVRGQRVELEAVESVLGTVDGVVEGAAFVLGDPPRLGAAVVIGPAADPGRVTAEIASTLRERLPGAAVPQTVDVVARLPRGTNGKIDRAALLDSIGTPADDRPPEGSTL